MGRDNENITANIDSNKSNTGDSESDIWAEFDKEAAVFQPIDTSTSKAGQIVTDRRSRLSSTKTKMLLF